MKISLYLDSGSGRFLLVNKDTKAREVVMLSLKEFGITECSTNFALVEVSPAPAHLHTCTPAHLHTCHYGGSDRMDAILLIQRQNGT